MTVLVFELSDAISEASFGVSDKYVLHHPEMPHIRTLKAAGEKLQELDMVKNFTVIAYDDFVYP